MSGSPVGNFGISVLQNVHRKLYQVQDAPYFAHGVFSERNLEALVGPNGVSHMHTYVLMQDGWWFTRTFTDANQLKVIKMLKDNISKHLILSRGVYTVFYAGQFYVAKRREGETLKVYMDNASGSFTPPAEELPNLQQLMKFNFPAVEVIVHDQATTSLEFPQALQYRPPQAPRELFGKMVHRVLRRGRFKPPSRTIMP
jgi:hypothetical protein